MFKVAINAGHCLDTPGKRCLKAIDPSETREWVLNSRICERIESLMKGYSGYELLRIDDPTGQTNLTISERAKKANDFGADIYISVHHNAGIKGSSGGGIIAYTYTKVDDTTRALQTKLYHKLIEKTGLRGNRSQPLATANFGECRETKMPAVLLECGFMDSTTDTPVILTERFADSAAVAITEAIKEFGNLTPAPIEFESDTDKMYYVQVGAYKEKSNAEQMVSKLNSIGYDAVIKYL